MQAPAGSNPFLLSTAPRLYASNFKPRVWTSWIWLRKWKTTKKNKFVCCGIYLQPETAEELCNFPAKPREVHRSPDNIKAPWEPESLPPAHLPAELRTWHPHSETPPLPSGLPGVYISGKTFSARCFSLLLSKQLCKGASRAVTSCCSPLPHVLSICDSIPKHTRVTMSMEAVGRYMQTHLGKLHSYYLADF